MHNISAVKAFGGKFSIKFCGTIDRHYQQGYINPDHGRFTFFKDVVWTSNDFNLVKGLVNVYNASAHRNHRELQNIYTIVQILPTTEEKIKERDVIDDRYKY
jgi:hypothetical protein